MRPLLRALFRRPAAAAAAPPPRDNVRYCPVCDGHFVCPMDWEPTNSREWRVVLRCPDCDFWYETTISNERASRLDRELDLDQGAIRRRLSQMDRERMAAEVERFVTALSWDLIEPSDFAR